MGVIHGPLPPDYITDGLVFHIDCANTESYPGSGTEWNSTVDSANDGTLNGDVTLGAGPLSGDTSPHMYFDGAADYVSFPQVGNALIQNPMTIEYWFNEENAGVEVDNDGVIVGNGGNEVNSFFIRQHAQVGDTGNVFFYFYPAGTSETSGRLFYANTPGNPGEAFIVPDAWGYISMTVDNATVTVYYNGQNQGAAQSDTISGGPAGTANPLLLGSDITPTYQYKGYIDIVRVYNRVLTAAEVLQNFDAEKSRFGL